MDLQAALDRADELGAAGRYFDAHEELEALWMKAAGEEKILLQGLIQITAGLHRLRRDPEKTDGALYLLDRGLEKLGKTKSLLIVSTFAALESAVHNIRASQQAPSRLAFGLRAR